MESAWGNGILCGVNGREIHGHLGGWSFGYVLFSHKNARMGQTEGVKAHKACRYGTIRSHIALLWGGSIRRVAGFQFLEFTYEGIP